MSDWVGKPPYAYVVRRDEDTVTVECPYCGQEHQHKGSGIVMAICMRGEYAIMSQL